MKKKLFLTIFRLGLFVLTSLLFLDTPASASDLSKRINIDEGSYTLGQFINMITDQSGYDFTYQATELPLTKKASIPMQDETVDKATEKLAKTFQLKVNILNNNIILKPGDARGNRIPKPLKGKCWTIVVSRFPEQPWLLKVQRLVQLLVSMVPFH